jgi:hypothetical protein
MKHISEVIAPVVEDLEPDEFVNCSITLLVPLDVPIDATDEEKSAAKGELFEALLEALPSEFDSAVGSARWEDVRDLGEAA